MTKFQFTKYRLIIPLFIFGILGIYSCVNNSKSENKSNKPSKMEEENYSILNSNAHKRAIELAPEEFFWDEVNELSPFGSDEGYTALSEFRRWRNSNSSSPLIECLQWTIESVGEMKFEQYNNSILNRDLILNQIGNQEYDDQQFIYTLDVSVIATGFGQLVDEGVIEKDCKDLIQIAISRQIIWAELNETWNYRNEYISNLKILERILKEA